MAIWQKNITVLPINKIKTFDNSIFSDEKTISEIWSKRALNSEKVINRIDGFIHRADWVNSEDWIYWKGRTEKYEDNDITLVFNKKSKVISAMDFRFDLRTESFKFIENIITICNDFDLGFISNNFELIEPKVSDYIKLIENNPLYKSKFPDYSTDNEYVETNKHKNLLIRNLKKWFS